MDYGIANSSGKPSKKEIFEILDLAWEKGVRRFDTAPGYGSELILGEFILANGFQNEIKILTKIPSLKSRADYEKAIKTSVESSLEKLGCPIEVLFFHDPMDSKLLLKDPIMFEDLLRELPVSTLGVSVYEPQEFDDLLDCPFDLAFQFPFNVLDRRFEQVNIPKGKRYARSVFLQGILASQKSLRQNAPEWLLKFHKRYHDSLLELRIKPIEAAVLFVVKKELVDYILIGVDSKKQLKDILFLKMNEQFKFGALEKLHTDFEKEWIDPREWS
jgi:aryl-alcohol dehydrogenase-like predicted oxidoreductase